MNTFDCHTCMQQKSRRSEIAQKKREKFENNKKVLNTVVGIVASIAIILIGYFMFIKEPQEQINSGVKHEEHFSHSTVDADMNEPDYIRGLREELVAIKESLEDAKKSRRERLNDAEKRRHTGIVLLYGVFSFAGVMLLIASVCSTATGSRTTSIHWCFFGSLFISVVAFCYVLIIEKFSDNFVTTAEWGNTVFFLGWLSFLCVFFCGTVTINRNR